MQKSNINFKTVGRENGSHIVLAAPSATSQVILADVMNGTRLVKRVELTNHHDSYTIHDRVTGKFVREGNAIDVIVRKMLSYTTFDKFRLRGV